MWWLHPSIYHISAHSEFYYSYTDFYFDHEGGAPSEDSVATRQIQDYRNMFPDGLLVDDEGTRTHTNT